MQLSVRRGPRGRAAVFGECVSGPRSSQDVKAVDILVRHVNRSETGDRSSFRGATPGRSNPQHIAQIRASTPVHHTPISSHDGSQIYHIARVRRLRLVPAHARLSAALLPRPRAATLPNTTGTAAPLPRPGTQKPPAGCGCAKGPLGCSGSTPGKSDVKKASSVPDTAASAPLGSSSARAAAASPPASAGPPAACGAALGYP